VGVFRNDNGRLGFEAKLISGEHKSDHFRIVEYANTCF